MSKISFDRSRGPAIFLMLLLASCGGGSGTTPVQPSGPSFPSVLGTWRGRLTTVAVIRRTGTRASGECSLTLILTGQNAGSFSGTLQLTSPCNQSGSVTGQVSTSGAVSGFTFSQALGGAGCTYVSGDRTMSGQVSATSFTVQSTETISCLGELADRNQVVTATK